MTDNELVARYDGATPNGGTTLIKDESCPIIELVKLDRTYHYVEGVVEKGMWSSAVLLYDTDWNWLMPIAKKVTNGLLVLMEGYGDDMLEPKISKRYNDIVSNLKCFQIKQVYNAVVRGINFLNENQNLR